MTRQEYREILDYELFRHLKGNRNVPIQRLRTKYFQPNTNCIYLARKMWYLYSKGGISRIRAKLLYLKIIRKYGCVIYPSAVVGRGFHITHPTGIVIGACSLVKGDLPSGYVYAGVPAKQIGSFADLAEQRRNQ